MAEFIISEPFEICVHKEWLAADYYEMVYELTKRGHVADKQTLERVTRCRDCTRFRMDERPGHVDFCALHNHLTAPDKFCAWGDSIQK